MSLSSVYSLPQFVVYSHSMLNVSIFSLHLSIQLMEIAPLSSAGGLQLQTELFLLISSSCSSQQSLHIVHSVYSIRQDFLWNGAKQVLHKQNVTLTSWPFWMCDDHDDNVGPRE